MLRKLKGNRGPRGLTGQQGPQGAAGGTGQRPAIAVYNGSGAATSSPMDQTPHTVATLQIPAAGEYVATAKLLATG